MSHKDTKGVHELLEQNFRKEYSIAGALNDLSTGFIRNLRFLGNYGEKKPEFNCLEKYASIISKKLEINKDCPQDATSEIIQRLFPSPDGDSFVQTSYDKDFLSFIGNQAIGKLIEKLFKITPQDLDDPTKVEQIVNEIKVILSDAVNPLHLVDEDIQKLGIDKKKIKKHAEKLKLKTPCNAEEEQILAQFNSIQEKLSQLDSIKKAMGVEQVGNTKVKRSADREGYERFARLLIQSLKENVYPDKVVIRALMAFVMKKEGNKADLMDLLSGMPSLVTKEANHLINPQGEKEQEAKQSFIDDRYTKVDYAHARWNAPHETKYFYDKNAIDKHAGIIAFAIAEEKFTPGERPHVVSYLKATHPSLGTEKYSDCAESAVRDIMYQILYNKELNKFDLNNLKHLKYNPKLRGFFEGKGDDPSEVTSQAIRNRWSTDVISELASPTYLKPTGAAVKKCELSAKLSNELKVLNDLLLPRESNPGRSLLSGATNADHLTAFCNAVQRDGFSMSWAPKKSSDLALLNTEAPPYSIIFKINNKKAFEWIFEPNHTYIKPLQDSDDLFLREGLRRGSINRATRTNQFYHELQSVDHVHKKDIEYVLSQDLSSSSSKIATVEYISKHRLFALYPLRDKLVQSLPLDDDATLLSLLSSFGDDLPYIHHFYSENDQRQQVLLGLLMTSEKPHRLQEMLEYGYKPKNMVLNRVISEWTRHHQNSKEVLEWILDHHPEVINNGIEHGKSIAHVIAAEPSLSDLLQVVLHKRPELMIQQDDHGDSILHIAAQTKNMQIYEKLIGLFPNLVHLRNKDGKVPKELL